MRPAMSTLPRSCLLPAAPATTRWPWLSPGRQRRADCRLRQPESTPGTRFEAEGLRSTRDQRPRQSRRGSSEPRGRLDGHCQRPRANRGRRRTAVRQAEVVKQIGRCPRSGPLHGLSVHFQARRPAACLDPRPSAVSEASPSKGIGGVCVAQSTLFVGVQPMIETSGAVRYAVWFRVRRASPTC